MDGAHERNRTFDLLLTKEVLYRLSYVSVLLERLLLTWNLLLAYRQSVEREKGIEPS